MFDNYLKPTVSRTKEIIFASVCWAFLTFFVATFFVALAAATGGVSDTEPYPWRVFFIGSLIAQTIAVPSFLSLVCVKEEIELND